MFNRIQLLGPALKISIAMLLIGAMFVIMHWPYGRVIVSAADAGILVFYSLRFAGKKEKTFLDYLKLILVCAWSVHGILAINHLSFREIFAVILWLLFPVWLVMEAIGYFEKPANEKGRAGQMFFAIAAVLIIAGALFKILHWPGAGPLIALGFLFAVIWLAMDR